jgi:hypothetical protein
MWSLLNGEFQAPSMGNIFKSNGAWSSLEHILLILFYYSRNLISSSMQDRKLAHGNFILPPCCIC